MESDIQTDSPSQEAELAGMFSDEPAEVKETQADEPELDIDLEEPTESEGEEPDEAEEEFEIKVNGKTQKLTKAQMIERVQKAEASQQKFEEAAAMRKEAEALKENIPQREKQLNQVLSHYIAQAQAMMPKEPNWQELLQSDIQNGTRNYEQQRLNWESRQRELVQAQQAKQVLDQRENEARSASTQARAMEELGKLQEAIPEWKDPSKATEGAKAIGNYLRDQGIPSEMIDSLDNHKVVLLARKAMLYDQALARRQTAQAAPKQVSVSERPQVSQAAKPKSQVARQNAHKAFSADPSIDTLASFF